MKNYSMSRKNLRGVWLSLPKQAVTLRATLGKVLNIIFPSARIPIHTPKANPRASLYYAEFSSN